MPKGRKPSFLPFAFLTLFCFCPVGATDFVFKGFRLQNPALFQDQIPADGSPEAIQDIFKRSGFFRAVTVVKHQETITVSVIEFPVLEKIAIIGSTVYRNGRVIDALGLKPGMQFNARILTENLQAFYRQSADDGYTHWQAKEIKMGDDGLLEIHIDEGILKAVQVANDAIDGRIVRKFFSPLLGKPFNTVRVKYFLEELLFTEAFYSVDSEVLHQPDGVILKITVDKKRLRGLKSLTEYSGFGGFRLYNYLSMVKTSDRMGFLDITTRYLDHQNNEFFQLNLDQFDFRRHLGRNHFSFHMEFYYLSFSDDDNLFFQVEPEYTFFPIKNLGLHLALNGGIHKNFNHRGNELIAEARGEVEYRYRSPLNRTEWSTGLEWVVSILHRYNRQVLWFDFVRRFLWGDFSVFGQWNNCSGEDLPFNYGFIRLEKLAVVNPEQIYSRDLVCLYAEFLSRPVLSTLRMGLLAQVFDAGETEIGYGLVSYLTIKGFPLRFGGWIQEGKLYLSAGTRISF